jgi:YidC/Oxa1 family membrane protein insertase
LRLIRIIKCKYNLERKIVDTKKLLLYATLGVLCFALWDAWNKDYSSTANNAAAPATAASTATTASSSSSGNATTIPAAAASAKSAPAAANAPYAPGKQPHQTQQLKAAATAASAAVSTSASEISSSQNRLVHVQTDTLDVAIDTVGGNVVQSKLLKYFTERQQPSAPVQLFDDNANKLYVAESGLMGVAGPDLMVGQGQYSVAKTSYVLQPDQQELQVKLLWQNKHNKNITVAKTFTFQRGQYNIKVDYEIDNKSHQPWVGQFYAAFKRREVKVEESGFFQFGIGTFSGVSLSRPDKPYEKIEYKKLVKSPINREVQGGWLALQQRYFLGAWIPEKNKVYQYFSSVATDDIYTIGFKGSDITVPANSKTTVGATLYSGPEIASVLKTIAPHLDLTIDYGWLWMISAFLFWVMQQIYKVVGNWGWAIILVTVLIKIAFFKLSESSYRSMAKMKDLAPKLQALKERLGDDKQKMSQATMELYRKEKVNPLGGCLPMLIQIPVFIGLYYVLLEAIELRHAPFMWWINDLSSKDPYYILPLLMGASMFLQQRLGPQSPDPMQAKMMLGLPIIFTVFFLSFPSGLVLYWLVNNCLSIAQQWYINQKYAKAHSHPHAVGTDAAKHQSKK